FPPPTKRLRRVLLHLSYSTTPSHRRLHDTMPISAVSSCKNAMEPLRSLDQLVGSGEDHWGQRKVEHLGSLHIDYNLKHCGLLDWQIAWHRSLEYLMHECGSPAVHISL